MQRCPSIVIFEDVHWADEATTVESYVTRILNKLGFDSRVQVATWAVVKGLK